MYIKYTFCVCKWRVERKLVALLQILLTFREMETPACLVVGRIPELVLSRCRLIGKSKFFLFYFVCITNSQTSPASLDPLDVMSR